MVVVVLRYAHEKDIMGKSKSYLAPVTKQAKKLKLRRLRETSAEREQRLARARERSRAIRARETSAERSLRRARARAYVSQTRKRMRERISSEHQKRLKQEGVLKAKKPCGKKPRAQRPQRKALVSPHEYF